jgi:hypothetical protein
LVEQFGSNVVQDYVVRGFPSEQVSRAVIGTNIIESLVYVEALVCDLASQKALRNI